MTAEITDDWLAQEGFSLVYYKSGRMAHLALTGMVNVRRREPIFGGSLCNRVPWWKEPLGTGSQDEYERARALPLCPACAVHGPEREWIK